MIGRPRVTAVGLTVALALAAGAGCGGSPGAAGTDGPTDGAIGSDTGDAPPSPTDAGTDAPPGDAAPDVATTPDGGADSADADEGDSGFVWNLPPGFPVPVVPDENPMSRAKVRLGRYLFYDDRLSHNGTQSCASCHEQARAFTDGRVTGVGLTGVVHPRNAMSLVNVAYASTLTWANPLLLDLEHQALVPMFGTDPVELGLLDATEIEQRLAATTLYPPLFADAWPGDPAPITLTHVVQALSSFERTIITRGSAYDRYLYGNDTTALSDSAKRGYQLFHSEDAECFHCHVGFNLTDHVNWAGKAFFEKPYHNTGLYNIDATGAYPEPNTGVYNVTRNDADMGKFKAPTLRNIAVTAPYMHDGSIATLEEVLDHYSVGGRTIASGPYAGVGRANPHKDPLIQPLGLSAEQRADLIAFLRSLTDEALLADPALSNPFAP